MDKKRSQTLFKQQQQINQNRFLCLTLFLFAVASNGGNNQQSNKYPKRVGDSLFITDSTYHLYKESICSNGEKTGETDLHKDGHLFDDVKPHKFEPPHYHGKYGEHFTYKKGKPESTNSKFKYH